MSIFSRQLLTQKQFRFSFSMKTHFIIATAGSYPHTRVWCTVVARCNSWEWQKHTGFFLLLWNLRSNRNARTRSTCIKQMGLTVTELNLAERGHLFRFQWIDRLVWNEWTFSPCVEKILQLLGAHCQHFSQCQRRLKLILRYIKAQSARKIITPWTETNTAPLWYSPWSYFDSLSQ